VKTARSLGFVVFCIVVAAAIAVPALRAQRAMPAARDARTAAIQKIDARVMTEISRRRGDPRQHAPIRRDVRVDRHGRALVDVRAQVRPALERKLRALGGVVVSTSTAYESIVGWVPLLTLERLAADPAVRAIAPAAN
jgi:hypothetical protein